MKKTYVGIGIVVLLGLAVWGFLIQSSREHITQMESHWKQLETLFDQRNQQAEAFADYLVTETVGPPMFAQALQEKLQVAQISEGAIKAQNEVSRALHTVFSQLFINPQTRGDKIMVGYAALIGKTEAQIRPEAQKYNELANQQNTFPYNLVPTKFKPQEILIGADLNL